jgi:hypothetical protein
LLDTFDGHIDVFDHILWQCRALNFKLRKEKLHLLQRQIRALGHVIGEGGVLKPVFDKVAAIINQPFPSNKEELLSFLGMAGYWRKFLPNYDVFAKPLYEMMSRMSKIKVSTDYERSVRRIKD